MLKINEKDIAIISNIIGIPFLSSLPGEGKVCFATNEEIRPEFLESFNEKHILGYILGCLIDNEIKITKRIQIPFPESTDSFWELVEKGNNKKIFNFETSEHCAIFFEK